MLTQDSHAQACLHPVPAKEHSCLGHFLPVRSRADAARQALTPDRPPRPLVRKRPFPPAGFAVQPSPSDYDHASDDSSLAIASSHVDHRRAREVISVHTLRSARPREFVSIFHGAHTLHHYSPVAKAPTCTSTTQRPKKKIAQLPVRKQVSNDLF